MVAFVVSVLGGVMKKWPRGLATAQTKSAPLTPIPCLAGGLLTKYKRSKGLINQHSLFSISSSLKQSL